MRQGTCTRTTTETTVSVSITVEGTGVADIDTGVGFLDHMLQQLARHALLDLTIGAQGDREIDDHHTVEDVGIALGRALQTAIGDARGIRRYGSFLLAMDDALAQVAIDVSGRPYLAWRASFPHEQVGTFDTSLVQEFFQALAIQAGLTLHVDTLAGTNSHHLVEACFKAAGRALRAALEPDPRTPDAIPSTKGVLGSTA